MRLATFDELEKADGIEYDTVEAYGLTLRLGSLSSGDIVRWNEAKAADESKAKEAGLRLLVMSIVDKDGRRIPEDQYERWLTSFRKKSDRYNSEVIEKVLDLNGLQVTSTG